ncbi:MAG: gliding motility protein GldN [Cryomorphaceae bacterium]|nr:gliding motility protein GldN [Cryomorphaceae bacterium]
MKRFSQLVFLFSAFFGLQAAFVSAQVLSPEDDGPIVKVERLYHNNEVIEFPLPREIDQLFSVRHWEQINVREKMNHHLYYPVMALPDRKSLFDVLIDGIMNEGTIMEVFAEDRFELPYTPEEIQNNVMTIDTFFNPDDPFIIDFIDTITVTAKDVLYYRVKSDWYFDKRRGQMENYIIGIAPIVQNPKTKDIYPLFWVWFPDARYALATNICFNRHNNAARLSYDDIFKARMFDAIIIKEDNVYDRAIADYKRQSALDKLLESKKIKQTLRNYENDLWEF